MKKLFTAVMALLILSTSFGSAPTVINPSVITPKALKASEIKIPLANGKTISLLELSNISRTDLEKLTGKKMSFVQRFAFKVEQKKLRKGINSDGIVTNTKIKKMFAEEGGGFNIGGFALGFLLGLIGVLIAYLAFKDDLKKTRIKWAWIGLGAAIILSLILFLLVFNSVKKGLTYP